MKIKSAREEEGVSSAGVGGPAAETNTGLMDLFFSFFFLFSFSVTKIAFVSLCYCP